MRLITLTYLGLLLAAVGCHQARVPTTNPAVGVVECVLAERQQDIQVLLDPGGGVRVDFIPHEGSDVPPCTVFLPADGKEVARLATVIQALAAARPAGLPAGSPMASPSEGSISIRIRRDGYEAPLRFSQQELRQDSVWDGVKREVEAVGAVDLARAVDSREQAGALAAQQKTELAVREMDRAVSDFRRWVRLRCDRYEQGIWEPELTMRFQYPSAHKPDERREIRGVPHGLTDLVDMDMSPEWTLKFYQYIWDTYTEGMTFSRSGAAFTVSVAARTIHSTPYVLWGFPSNTIPADVLKALRKAATW